jgi:hypothetical protein
LDGDKPFYRSYVCADGKFVAVGALERPFFEALWKGLALGDVPDHMSAANWPQIGTQLAATFCTRTRDEWAALFQGTDACVTPVLDPTRSGMTPVHTLHWRLRAKKSPACGRRERLDFRLLVESVVDDQTDAATINRNVLPNSDRDVPCMNWRIAAEFSAVATRNP